MLHLMINPSLINQKKKEKKKDNGYRFNLPTGSTLQICLRLKALI